MTQPQPSDGSLEPTERSGVAARVPGQPPVTTAVPMPAADNGVLPGVQLAQRPKRHGDTFGWPSNAAPRKPEGEVDTRPGLLTAAQVVERGGNS